ncbi:MAG: DUF4097 family beta strand repeat-containing protein [Gemmatimonadaceae bacterium]
MISIRARFAQNTTYAVAVASLLLAATTSNAQSRESRDESFSWTGAVGAGRSVIIKNINGAITVEHSTGNRVEVSAEKRWRRGNPTDVRIVQPQTSSGDVLICALWTTESTCDADGIHTPRNRGRDNDRNNNDVSVHFTVRVPDGVRVDLNTVNGGIEVSGVSNEVDAVTVNGSIEARSSGGPVRGRTVNGSITIGMGSLRSSEDLEYETVNGSVTLELPSNFGAQLELSTVNGRVNTDFPITVVGTLSPRKLRGTVGNGSSHIRATTVNGSVTLRRSN